jgi:hypothetical protein
MDVVKVLALIRRYAVAIAEGRIEARKIKSMTDAELASYDDDLFAELDAKQKEAEQLAERNTEPVNEK